MSNLTEAVAAIISLSLSADVLDQAAGIFEHNAQDTIYVNKDGHFFLTENPALLSVNGKKAEIAPISRGLAMARKQVLKSQAQKEQTSPSLAEQFNSMVLDAVKNTNLENMTGADYPAPEAKSEAVDLETGNQEEFGETDDLEEWDETTADPAEEKAADAPKLEPSPEAPLTETAPAKKVTAGKRKAAAATSEKGAE